MVERFEREPVNVHISRSQAVINKWLMESKCDIPLAAETVLDRMIESAICEEVAADRQVRKDVNAAYHEHMGKTFTTGGA